MEPQVMSSHHQESSSHVTTERRVIQQSYHVQEEYHTSGNQMIGPSYQPMPSIQQQVQIQKEHSSSRREMQIPIQMSEENASGYSQPSGQIQEQLASQVQQQSAYFQNQSAQLQKQQSQLQNQSGLGDAQSFLYGPSQASQNAVHNQSPPGRSDSSLPKEWPPKNGTSANMTSFPSGFKLREEAPIQQPGAQVVPSQPAFKITQPLRQRGDEKWPPRQFDDTVTQEQVREFIRPKKQNRDYGDFFAQNALPGNYSSYRPPPGTQHVKVDPEDSDVIAE